MQFILVLLPVVLGTGNMNPAQYTVSNPLSGFEGKSYPFIGDYFEVQSPAIRNRYGDIYYNMLGPVPLPQNIIEMFNGSSIAVTGYEVDVRRTNNVTGEEEHVPCYQSYNHHYAPMLLSSYAQLKRDKFGKLIVHKHGHGKVYEVELKPGMEPPKDAQLVQSFVHGNGNEHRQIYHGAPQTFVQPIYSPNQFLMAVMQINTNDGSGTKGPHGPVPKFSRDNLPANTPYSPLLECPCTDRIVKKLGGVGTTVNGRCSRSLGETDCFSGVADAFGNRVQANKTVSRTDLPAGCSISRLQPMSEELYATFNTNSSSPVSCQGSGDPSKAEIYGNMNDLVGLSLSVSGVSQLATIILSGPANVWFGVGFNASLMHDLPYAIIVDGKGQVTERKLADHDPGVELNASVTVVSSTVTQGIRTVTLQRPLQGASSDHYTFSPLFGTIPLINAIGNTVDLQQHAKRGSVLLLLLQDGVAPTCVCKQATGTIAGIPYDGDCRPEPWSDLLRDNNPTCEVSSYIGGLACCVDQMILLDQEQDQPEYVDEVFFRFRFYYTKFDAQVMNPIYHVEWSVNGCDSGDNGPNPHGCSHIEFDVVKGTNSSFGKDVAVYTSHFPAVGLLSSSCSPTQGQCMDGSKAKNGIQLIMAAAHCHAPNCLKEELWNADTGELLCGMVPIMGRSSDPFDENGYLFAPPCTWGSAAEGFRSPPVLQLNTNLTMIAYYNSTYQHTGQMGILQMKAAFVN